MKAKVDQRQENKSQSISNGRSQTKSNNTSVFRFADNRPIAVTQRKFQEMANRSPKVHPLKEVQHRVKSSGFPMGPVIQKVDLRVRYSQTPHIHGHIDEAIDRGNPSKLTKNSALANQNRSDAAKSYFGTNAVYNATLNSYSFPSAGDGMSWDEYPFACTEEGGTDSSLQKVPVGEQHIQGGQLSHIPAGKFNVVLADD